MIFLQCVIERVTYQNPENGYAVLKAKSKGYNDLVTLVGYMADVPAGSVVKVKGDWKVDKKYGEEFVVETWEEMMPATLYGIEKYLGSGLVKGVGPAFAKRIVQKFGLETIDVIEYDSDRLFEVEGLGAKRIQQIRESWERQKDIKEVMLFLQSHGVSTAYATKIYHTYGKNSIDKVNSNPYCLADDIWGIGFKTADSIARTLGYEKEDVRRCRSGILYALSQLSNDGHVFALKDQLITKAKELLEAGEEVLESTLNQMVVNKDVFVEEDGIYLPPFYYAEKGSADKLRELMACRVATSELLDFGTMSGKGGIEYDEVQLEAIHEAMKSKVMVLTGGPGTGKTTTTQGIIAALKSMGLSILLAAPTGRAAKRMSEATGMPAKTIHRLLVYKPAEGYQRNEDNPLDGDVLILDEASMIDILLLYSLLKAIPVTMRVLFVGDIDQLPSVGAGNVLRDLIDSGCIPVVRLTRIFRQAQSSRIVMNAHRINQGVYPDVSNGKDTDFFFMNNEDPETVVATIVDLVKNRLPNAYHESISNIQVLSPMHRGVVGSERLNTELQKAINPEGVSISRGGSVYRLGDRIMQIRNNYDKDVFNGDIGKIVDIDLEERIVSADFDGRMVTYEAQELDEVVLAYATTIHKSQGSEYPIVVIPVLMSHFMMLERNLIYTAITRSKKICVLIGSPKALSYSVRNLKVNKRNSRLKDRLKVDRV